MMKVVVTVNKRQIEVQQVTAENEQRIIRQLKQVYNQASKDCAAKIQELSMRTDMENLQTIIYQKQYQEAMKKQIDAVLNELNSKSFTSIADYLGECYETGFIGTLYDLQGQGIPLCFPINQEEVVQALQVDSKILQGLYQRMGEDTEHLKKSIKAELSRGISNGSSWNAIAGKIASGMNSPFTKAYNRAIGIARTEGHRVQQESTLHCQQRAKAKGADVVKQWDSTLDGVTRLTHRELDGQIKEVDEPFEVAGMKAMYPGAFGNPAEDCNCRCCLLQRARWALSTEEFITKFNGDTGELVKIPAKSYDEFKTKVDTFVKEEIHYKIPESKDYTRILHGSQGAVSIDDRIQIAKHEKADGSQGGYVATTNYQTINSNMRNDGFTGNRLDEDDIKTIESLRRAISQYQLDEDLILTRYVNGDYLSSVFGLKMQLTSKSNLENITDSITRISNPYVVKTEIPRITAELQAQIGNTITEKAFISTSVLPNKNIMQSKSVCFKVRAKKGTNCYLPVNRKESECIFSDDSKLLIQDVQWDDSLRKWIITVDIE